MTAGWEPTPLAGVLRRRVVEFPDERGSFAELWRASWTDDLGRPFVQANVSRSAAGVLRGMHYHRRQHDLWIVLEGDAYVALTDVRGSDGGTPRTHTFEAAAGSTLLIPPRRCPWLPGAPPAAAGVPRDRGVRRH